MSRASAKSASRSAKTPAGARKKSSKSARKSVKKPSASASRRSSAKPSRPQRATTARKPATRKAPAVAAKIEQYRADGRVVPVPQGFLELADRCLDLGPDVARHRVLVVVNELLGGVDELIGPVARLGGFTAQALPLRVPLGLTHHAF